MVRILCALALALFPAANTAAETASLFRGAPDGEPLMRAAGAPLLTAPPTQAAAPPTGSLFAGTAGLFTPRSAEGPGPTLFRGDGGTAAAQLKSLIAEAEAGPAGYDAVQHGARIKPVRPPTQMTIGEIYAWIDDTPGQPHAIGRYQFIPPTLRRLVAALDLPPTSRFTPQVQDRLAERLLLEAGMDDFLAGSLDRVGFMNNLAKIWAGLPNSSGRSHYHGYAGNKATMTWAVFDREIRRIFGDA